MSDIQNLYNYYNLYFSGEITTLKECSADYHNPAKIEYLSNSSKLCFNLDKVKNHFYTENPCCTADSLYFDIDNNSLCFIEFKNGHIEHYVDQRENVIKSGIDSFILNGFISYYCGNVDLSRINIRYFLVVNSIKNSSLLSQFKSRTRSRCTNRFINKCFSTLTNQKIMDNTLYFNDFVICSGTEFDNMI